METPPPDLPQDVKSAIFDKLDQELNCIVLQALLHGKVTLFLKISLLNHHFAGLYTGIVAITSWSICMLTSWTGPGVSLSS